MRNVTVLTPTNSRPHSLRNSLQAVFQNLGEDCHVIVLNSTPSTGSPDVSAAYVDVFKAFPTVKVLTKNTSIGPSEARFILAKECQTELMLFIDDDIEIRAGSYDLMARAMQTQNLDIVSGRWIEEGGERPLGFWYSPGTRNGEEAIFKLPIHYAPDFDGTVVECDDVLSTMLCRKAIFERVAFDPIFDFYFELFDFFMACRKENIRIGVATDAVFDHKPTPYMGVSKRQTQRREDDEARFVQKWGIRPVPTPLRSNAKVRPRRWTRLLQPFK